MTTAADMTSLLQLGVGIGLGLAFFKAGAERKFGKLKSRLARAYAARIEATTSDERKMQSDTISMRARLAQLRTNVGVLVVASQWAAFLGGSVCAAILTYTCLNAANVCSTSDKFWIIWWSLGYFAAELLITEAYMYFLTAGLDRDIKELERARNLRK